MAADSPRMRLASLIIGQHVVEFIADRRANGESWPAIRLALRDATDGEVDITWQAVQQWHNRAVTPVALRADGAA